MSTTPSRLAPVYDAIDSEDYEFAIKIVNKALKKPSQDSATLQVSNINRH